MSISTAEGRGPAHPDFTLGLSHFQAGEYREALACFRKADFEAGRDDLHRHCYTSYHGLTLVCLGDPGGLALCRAAVDRDELDVELFRNLALAELQARNRRRAVAALGRGLAVDPEDPTLLELRRQLGVRRLPLVPFLGRDHLVNRFLGKLTYRRRGRGPSAGGG